MTATKQIAVYTGAYNVNGARVGARLDERGIAYTSISEKDVISNDLARYSAIVFPGGHSVQIGAEGDDNVRAYVRGGGGFLGICAGLHYGVDLGLLDVGMMYMRGRGTHQARVVKEHPVTAGYDILSEKPLCHTVWSPVAYSPSGRVKLSRANGGIIIPGKDVDVLVTYDDTDRFAAVVAASFGKGRVVLISPHPEGSEKPDPEKEEDGQDALGLFFNAVAFVVGSEFANT